MKKAFYHIYPLGLTGAPERNDFVRTEVGRIGELYEWIDHMKALGMGALYLGPVFESSSHGYDTVDYYRIDSRLGSNSDFTEFCSYIRNKGIELFLDGVFNHVSRDFAPFQDLLARGEESPYRDWFRDVEFSPFSCRCWEGHEELVELNLSNREVRDHLLGAVEMWYREFGIKGLRLDVAYCLDKDFLRELRDFTRTLDKDFKLLGEVIHGDYREWIEADLLDMTTNYECYKGIYSSLNDANYFEIAYSLNRLFGEEGIYGGYDLYNFIDNHDVNRIASILNEKAHLYPALIMLFTIPGTPSVYYGSEWGIEGERDSHSDKALRPHLKLPEHPLDHDERDVEDVVKTLLAIRKNNTALKGTAYRELYVDHKQFVFLREDGDSHVLCAFNSSDEEAEITIDIPGDGFYEDLLNGGAFVPENGRLKIHLWPNWGAILNYNDK